MHKIVNDQFELDLTNYQLSLVEENKWFTNNSFTKFSFPFSIYLTDELIKVFGYFLDDRNIFLKTTFDVFYFFGDKKERAIFEIESQVGKTLDATLRFGFDELQNWDKKLSELPLEVTQINDIITHAKTIIPLSWPDVNYNYPQIYTDKYDEDEDVKFNYNSAINKYDGTNFWKNKHSDDYYPNHNIIQPTPYLLHVLQQGFLDAGFVLRGDILNHPLIKKIVLYADLDYFKKIKPLNHNVIFTYDDPVSSVHPVAVGFGYSLGKYKRYNLNKSAKYKVTGYVWVTKGSTIGQYSLRYKNTVISSYTNSGTSTANGTAKRYDIDEVFYTDSDEDMSLQTIDVLVIAKDAFKSDGDPNIVSLQVTRITESGADFPTIIEMYNDVNLKRSVPNVTFGKLVTEVNKLFNLELDPRGTDMYVNLINNQINYNDSVDLSEHLVSKPKKKFNTLQSLLLKYNQPNNESYKYEEVYQDKSSIEIGYNLGNSSTDKVEVDLLPLFQINYGINYGNQSQIRTAHSFDLSGADKIYLAIYGGLIDGLNTTEEIEPVLMPQIYDDFHKKFFSFKLNAVSYSWSFKMYLEKLLKLKKKVYAYGRYHVIKELEKQEISKDLFEVEINTETLE
ncbi:hypothetical protein [Tenacibaculum soleae]|uniref:hypothetical protein n=1 Tax=Tenacibaculum soleae TaxID=447689 RepID=UPI002300AB1C|nr:hypothetical protein [Tenacibaculum soleae]